MLVFNRHFFLKQFLILFFGIYAGIELWYNTLYNKNYVLIRLQKYSQQNKTTTMLPMNMLLTKKR